MDEETAEVGRRYELGCFCTCRSEDDSSEKVEIPPRKQFILNTVARTENYLRERRLPELIRFLFTKIIAEAPDKPVTFLEQLLDDCMLFRARHGSAPVLFEKRHLEAIVKSFDPGNRGWVSAGQLRRIYSTLGLPLDTQDELYEERYSCEVVLQNIKKAQEIELFDLLSSGMVATSFDNQNSDKSTTSK